jgi:hypothetical protein
MVFAIPALALRVFFNEVRYAQGFIPKMSFGETISPSMKVKQ